jgi:hypothetical protein
MEAIDVDKSGNVQGSLAEVQMDALVKDTQVRCGQISVETSADTEYMGRRKWKR